MAQILELPIDHPARRSDPFNLRKKSPPKAGLDCPFNCGEKFEGHWKLYLHLLERHPERRDAKG